jgi:hypothetical protein
MASEVHSTFPNYYEYLNVTQDAPVEVIERALGNLTVNTETRLNNQLTMQSALQIVNEIIPAIRQHLLSNEQARADYDRQLVAAQRRLAGQDELADDEGLDDMLRQPFFFDPFEGYDTETPALSLRQIAIKLDEEWSRACTWITDTSDELHVFVGFLTHVAGRQRLAKHIEEIIQAVARKREPRMEVNEAIERCINILDPQVDRPLVNIYNPIFDGKALHAGDFISDQPAQADLMLVHGGIRGCTFGVVESRTDWLTFQGRRTSIRFSLMPEGPDPKISVSEVKIPLFFQLNRLERNTDHTAQLILRIENHDPAIEVPISVQIHVLPLPPRVSFEPPATAAAPAWAGTTLRGVPASAVVVSQNAGDESLVPLTARMYTRDPGAKAEPVRFHADEQVKFTIDTTNRSFGSKYEVIFNVDYGPTPGAIGPAAIHVQGEILPTAWQSMLRQKSMGERSGVGCIAGCVGLFLLGSIAVGLAGHTGITWLLFFAVPVIFVLTARPIAATIIRHIQRSGNSNVTMEKVPLWVLWWLPLGAGLLLAVICVLMLDMGTAFLIGAIVGGIVGAALGFILDGTGAAKAGSSRDI